MTTNPRDTIERALLADTWTAPSVDHPHPDWHRRFAPWMAALAARIALDAICPPGSRVVVSRESKPCATCEMHCAGALFDCPECGGSGVVEATTIHGLAEVRLGWIDEDGAERPLHPFAVERMLGDETLYRLEQVALPEETPQ